MTNGKPASTAEKYAREIQRCAFFLGEHAEDLAADLDKMVAIGPTMRIVLEMDSHGACYVCVDRKYLVQ